MPGAGGVTKVLEASEPRRLTVDSLFCLLLVGGGQLLQCGLHAPDLTGVLRDGAVAGELAAAGDVVDNLLGPFLGVLSRRQKQVIDKRATTAAVTETNFSTILLILIF